MPAPIIDGRFKKFEEVEFQKFSGYAPTAFSTELTILEKMNRMMYWLNKLGVQWNDLIDLWLEVIEWVLGEGLQEAVEGKLNEWLADGTLAQIINEEIFGELNNRIGAVELELTNLINNLNDFKAEVEATKMNKDDIFYINVKQSPYNLLGNGTVETEKIQEMFDLAQTLGKVTLYFPKGTYVFNKHIRIHGNTTVFGDGEETVLKRVGSDLQTFLNGENGNMTYASGYDGDSNIHFHDLKIDLNRNGSSVPVENNINCFALAHAKNLIFERIQITGGQNGHYFQLASVKDVVIRDCIFRDQEKTSSGSTIQEVIQIEYAGVNSFPTFGSYDLTPSKSITIENNVFENVIRGVGNHSTGKYDPNSETVYYVTDINIVNNRLVNIDDVAIPLIAFKDSMVFGNYMENVGYGIQLRYSYDIQLVENFMRDVQRYGVWVDFADDNVFKNTTIINTSLLEENFYSAIRVSDGKRNTFDGDIVKGSKHYYAFFMSGSSEGNKITNKRYQKGMTGTIIAGSTPELRTLTIGDESEVLFEGEIGTTGVAHTLSNTIRDYSFIVVVMNDSLESVTIRQQTMVIPRHTMVAGASLSRFKHHFEDGISIEFSFPGYTSIQLDTSTGNGRIRQVIGIV